MSLREVEASSIRAFVQSAADEGYLSGRVLDYGCGKQPYRDIVEAAGGEYLPFDRAEYPANTSGEDIGNTAIFKDRFDAILSTQTAQYISYFGGSLKVYRRDLLSSDGHLVLTYPTNWPEVEAEDLHRFTKAGMDRLLTEAGFTIIRHERRAELVNRDGTWALGYGVICRV